MSEKKKEAPESEQEEGTLTPEELEKAAGGIIIQSGNLLNLQNTMTKAPTIGAPQLPGTGGSVL